MHSNPGVSPGINLWKNLPLRGRTITNDETVMTIDPRGAIVSCSRAAAALFNCSRYDLETGTIWSLFSDLAPDGRPRTYSNGQLGRLRDDGDWQRFNAVNVYGHEFPVDVALSKDRLTADKELFELRLRRTPGA